MARELDLEAAESKARELLDARISSVRGLVRAAQAEAEVRAQMQAAAREHAKAYAAAIGDGWTPDELRKLGLQDPERSARSPRRSSAAARPVTTAESAAESGD
ncbi:hypothetical protein [Cellulosimicrobium cellulans]|uniref:Uncharacterized protein n=1 Tax=Cellulosimicrobium cellulans TaxID=1710 RepID=A0A4Y4E9I1_CELCE|nr:hypothetical protein [Cellulosimicrobium cellulans]GED11311.1 hypothetical protein CCE02nite_33100 [Cellulosimicrobium cellulans]